MPTHVVETPRERYPAVIERGILTRVGGFLPAKAGRVFVTTTEDVWALHGEALSRGLADHPFTVLFFPGGEERKRLAQVEALAEQMMQQGGDRSSVVVAFGGGVLTDVSGFLAAIFQRGVPFLQVPTTLLAQVDAAVGGKTGVNLVAGKNLIGAFHQPLAVLIDPNVIATLPDREYRAGLYEVLKHGLIRSAPLYEAMEQRVDDVLRQEPALLEMLLSESVRIKAEVVSADEREHDLRRILNFGHTVGHALEAATGYKRFLHGEAVAFGMRVATVLSRDTGLLRGAEADRILRTITRYGPVPSLAGIDANELTARTAQDKKTVRGTVHFVLLEAIGRTRIVSGIAEEAVTAAIRTALHE